MHQLLLEQIKNHIEDELATNEQLQAFFDVVNQSYKKIGTLEEKLRKIFNGSNDALFIIQPKEDRILEVNPKAIELLGYNADQLLKIKFSIIHPTSLAEFDAFLEEVYKTGYGWTNEIISVTSRGDSITTEMSASLIKNEPDNLVLIIMKDVSVRRQTANIMSAQRSFFRQVIDANPSLIFAKDIDGKYTIANQAMADVMGTTIGEIIGKQDEDFDANLREIAGNFEQDEHVFRTGNDFIINEAPLLNNQTRKISYRQIIKRPLKDTDGKTNQVLGIINDVTELKLAKEEIERKAKALEELSEISREISISTDLDGILKRVTRSIGESLETASIYISDWQGNDGASKILAEYIGSYIPEDLREESIGKIFNLKEDFKLVHQTLADKQSLLINVNDNSLPTELKAFYQNNQCKIALYEPIVLDGHSFGYVEIYEHEKQSFSESTLEEIKAYAYQLAIAFTNNTLVGALQSSEQRFRSVIENTNDVITITDPDGVIQYSNPSTELAVGYSPEELINKSVTDFVHKDDVEEVLAGFKRAVENPDAKRRLEFRFKHKNGNWVHLSSSSKPVIQENGELQLFITTRDVTNEIAGLAQQQEKFERRGRQVQFTRNLSRQIPQAQNRAELYELVAKSLQTGLDDHYHIVKIYRANQATNQLTLTVAAGVNQEALLKHGHTITWGETLVGRAASLGTSFIISNTADQLNWVPTPTIEGTKSAIATPVILGDDVLAVIHIESTEPEDIDEDVQILLELISGQLAIAVESLRLQREMEERLTDLSSIQQSEVSLGWESYKKAGSSGQGGYFYEPGTEKHRPLSDETAIQHQQANKLSAPMMIRGETIGALSIQTDESQPLAPDEQALLEEITAEVSEALERARLFESSQRSAAELAVLNRMGNAFTEALDDQSIIENIYTYASQLLEIDDFFVALHNEQTNTIHFPLVYINGERLTAESPQMVDWLPRPADKGLTGYIVQKREPILIENNAEEVLTSRGLPYIQAGAMTQSWLGVPMLIGDRVLGVINAQSDERDSLYNEHHLGLFTAIASQASIAIDNARLFQQEQKRAEQERLVRTITDRVRRGADTQTILQITLEEISKVLESDYSVVKLGTDEQILQELENNEPNNATQNGSGKVKSKSNGAK